MKGRFKVETYTTVLESSPSIVEKLGEVIFESKYIRVIEYINKHGHKMRYCINKKIKTKQPETVHNKTYNRHLADKKIYKENMEVR